MHSVSLELALIISPRNRAHPFLSRLFPHLLISIIESRCCLQSFSLHPRHPNPFLSIDAVARGRWALFHFNELTRDTHTEKPTHYAYVGVAYLVSRSSHKSLARARLNYCFNEKGNETPLGGSMNGLHGRAVDPPRIQERIRGVRYQGKLALRKFTRSGKKCCSNSTFFPRSPVSFFVPSSRHSFTPISIAPFTVAPPPQFQIPWSPCILRRSTNSLPNAFFPFSFSPCISTSWRRTLEQKIQSRTLCPSPCQGMIDRGL